RLRRQPTSRRGWQYDLLGEPLQADFPSRRVARVQLRVVGIERGARPLRETTRLGAEPDEGARVEEELHSETPVFELSVRQGSEGGLRPAHWLRRAGAHLRP